MPPSAGTSKSVATLGKAPLPRAEEKTMFLPSGVQPDDGIRGAVEGNLARLAAGGGDDVHVVVALAVGGESDPVAVGREARVLVAGLVVGEAQDARAVFIGDPDVAEIAEGDFAFGVSGMAEKFHLRLGEHR